MRHVSTPADSDAVIDLHDLLVSIPSVSEVVTASLQQLRPQFNLTDEQIERLGKQPIAGTKPSRAAR